MPDLPTNLSQGDMRQRIKNERRIELAFEEHPYLDVRRWKIAEETGNITVKAIKITKTANGTDILNCTCGWTGFSKCKNVSTTLIFLADFAIRNFS